MKIIQIATFFHPVTGGVETHVLNLSRELEKNGHEVEVLCLTLQKLENVSQSQTPIILVLRFIGLGVGLV